MSIGVLKEGILEGNWDKVKQFYTSITGESLDVSHPNKVLERLGASAQVDINDFIDTGTEHLDDLKFMPKVIPGRKARPSDGPKEITTQCIECHRPYTVSTIFLRDGMFTCNKCVGGGGRKKK